MLNPRAYHLHFRHFLTSFSASCSCHFSASTTQSVLGSHSRFLVKDCRLWWLYCRTSLQREMGEAGCSAAIRAINKSVVHRICSGQVILDLSSAVKELVENSLDAGATSIEISLKDYGEAYFKVADNGSGISPRDFQALAFKHHTSKISEFSDIHSLTTFGFRGEALSSLCALGDLIIETRTKNEPVGTRLTFDHSGAVKSETKTARQIGTTVTVERLFSTLPVRSKEFKRNIRREYGKLISLLNAYALIAKGVRLVCTNVTGKNTKSVVLKTQGSSSLKDNIITVLGLETFRCLDPLDISISDSCKIEGFISKPGNGNGRTLGDRQLFFINDRPVDMPKVSKLMNQLYRCFNSKQHPIAIMNFIVSTKEYDINVTPDKRKIFFSDEATLMLSLKEAIESLYSPSECNYAINKIEECKRKKDEPQCNPSDGADDLFQVSNAEAPMVSDCMDAICYPELIENDSSKVKEEHQLISAVCQVISPSRVEESSLKNLKFAACQTSKARNFFPSKHEQERKITVANEEAGRSSFLVRPGRKDNVGKPNVLCPHFSQSSLTKFVAVTKRKHENNCSELSELPILRNETGSHQLRRTTSDDVSVFKDITSVRDKLKNLSEEESSDITKPPCNDIHKGRSGCDEVRSEENLHKIETTLSVPDKLLNALEFSPSDHLKNQSEGSLSKIPHETNDIKANCTPVAYSVLQFDIKDLRTRRSRRISKLHSSLPTDQNKFEKRCYMAATLDSFYVDDHGKEKNLAAATIELERSFKKQDFVRMKVVGQFNLGFIIGKLDSDLFIVDQHAADEKYNFERLSKSTVLNQQPLLQPMRLELSPEEEIIATMHMGTIRKNGFSLIEDPHALPGHHFLLKAVPFSKNITFGLQDIKELISSLVDSQGESSLIGSYRSDTSDSICPSRVRAMLASRACHSSVTVGDPLAHNEMKKILQNLASLKSPWNCPHGRPTMRHLVDLAAIHSQILESAL